MNNAPFAPTYGETQAISATTSTSFVTIVKNQYNLLVVNAGSVPVFINSGSGTAVATTSDAPVGAGESRVFRISAGHDKVAAITASGSATVYVNPGSGGH